MTTTADALTGTTPFRVRPTVALGVAVYVVYLAIFYTTWAINDVDYGSIGESLESTKLHYAYPTLFACASTVVLLTVLGWWRISLFDKSRNGPTWVWIGPVVMIAIGLIGFSMVDIDHPEFSGSLVVWSLLGGLGVGFGEEMITRGTLIVGLRSKYGEWHVWLYSSLLFAALHIPNVFFGLIPIGLPFQLLNTFIFATALYGIRRFTGTLILPIIIHGLWDSGLFIPRATETAGSFLPVLAAPFMIAIGYAMVQRNKGLRLSLDGAVIESANDRDER